MIASQSLYLTRRACAVLLTGGVLLAAGCGNASTPSPTTSKGTASPASGRGGGSMKVAINVSLADLDPLTNSGDPYRNSVRLAMFDTLTRYDGSKLVPSLATWTARDEGKAYDFTIRPGVRFSDGKALTANDVKYT